jgi:hypothetical protein
MSRSELQECVSNVAERYALRTLDGSTHALGLHQGTLVDVSEFDGVIELRFGSPLANIGDEILEHFAGFRHCAEAGIPTVWINGLMERDASGHEKASNNACVIRIDKTRLDQLGVDALLRIPDTIAHDLHEHGAPHALPCGGCGQKTATTLAFVDAAYAWFCTDCWQELNFHSSGGKLGKEQKVKWSLAIPLLAVLTVLGALGWGYLQQPKRLDRFGFYSTLLPVGWAFVVCLVVPSLSGGVTRALRLLLMVSVVISVLAGNIWGYRSFVVQQVEQEVKQPVVPPNWMESVSLYFAALPKIGGSEVPFLLGGIIGAWIGLRMLRREEYVRIR